MKWNNEKGYLTFQSSYNNLKVFLGISTIDLVDRCEFIPYYTYILKHLSDRLILLVDTDMKSRLQEVFDIFELGVEKIAACATLDLAWDLDIETSDFYIEGDEIPYNQEHLVFAWTSLYTSLCTRLKLQYSHLLYQTKDNNCGCSEGDTTKDFESWTSGVYPEDEEYSSYSIASKNTSWRTGVDNVECTKCLRNI